MASSTSWVHLLVAFAAPLATTRAASLIEAGRDGWTASGTRYVVIRDLDPENSGADCDGHWSVDSIGFYTGPNLARAPTGYYICNRNDYNIADNRHACGAAECHGTTTDGCPGWNSSMTGSEIGYIGVDFGHGHVINGFKIKQRAGCGTSRVELVHGHQCGSTPCSTGGQMVARFALNRAGGVFEDVTEMWRYTGAPTAPTGAPTSAPSTSRPTAAPTPRPIVNTVADCGRHHVACDGQLGAGYQGSGISCPAPAGNPNGRCVCTGPYHCRGTEARGTCADARDHCLERGITASPTAPPTTSGPTASPTASPTSSPASSAPTEVPTAVPTAAPSTSPTSAPTSSAPTAAPTAAPTEVPTAAAPGRSSNSASQADEDSGSGTLVVVIVVAVLLLIGVVLGARYYVKSSLANAKTAGARSGAGFGNPGFDATPAVFDGSGAQQTAGYIDIPASSRAAAATGYMDVAPAAATGYMDVAPAVDDDEEEDV